MIEDTKEQVSKNQQKKDKKKQEKEKTENKEEKPKKEVGDKKAQKSKEVKEEVPKEQKEKTEKFEFSKQEIEISNYWKEIDAFKQQLELTKDCPPYTFYDGPPFATGTPHYGHITAGTLKDVVTRYWTQNGYYCERRFGWDCHGLPIEVIVNKLEDVNIKTKKDLLAYGIDKYNKKCRENVQTYAKEWEEVSTRFGRWIDFRNDYKTMDLDFMESVWWVFKQIFNKGLVYRKFKVMPYSWSCNTTLSNFEAGQNYKNIEDPSLYITFPWKKQENRSFVAWTTTPWTLPANLAVTLNPEFVYVIFKDKNKNDNKEYIVTESLLEKTAKMIKIEEIEVIDKKFGKELEDIEYIPLFDTFASKFPNCFRSVCDPFVTAEDGTGIVHTAPAFGEDDFRVSVAKKLIKEDSPLIPIDDDGNFTSDFALTAGMNFKEADPVILKNLKERGRLLASGTLIHKYPMCYRTHKPLMYKAMPSWFIKVEDVKEKLIENNKKAYWVPSYVQEKRFHNWLKDAKDWCVSRSRSWGNPIPLWVSDDLEEVVCIESIDELCKEAGISNLTDIHKEFVDNITIPSKKGKGLLRRIPEIFDCWFESGSMPFAQVGFPKKMNKEEFMKRFPAEFIAEGIDQTRGWFYTLNVISTIVLDSNPYKNLICNGLVLAKDGSKMSKSQKNYTDPMVIFNTHSADAVRLYLMNSPLVKGQNLKFDDDGVEKIITDIFLPLLNSFKFLVQNIQRYELTNSIKYIFNDEFLKENLDKANITDKWILAYSQRLIGFVRKEMESYRLYTVVAELLAFLDKLTNWYIRLNRGRIKGDSGKEESYISLTVLFKVFLELNILLSPFIPFLTESFYLQLRNSGLDRKEKSIHFLRIPQVDYRFINDKVEKTIENMIVVIEQGRYLREQKKVVMKMPVANIQIINSSPSFRENIATMENYILEELNTNQIEFLANEKDFVKITGNPNFEVLYSKSKEIKEFMKEEGKETDPKLIEEEATAKKEANYIAGLIKKLDESQLAKLMEQGFISTGDEKCPTININQVLLKKEFLKEHQNDKNFYVHASVENSIRISTVVNDNMMNSYYARDLANKIQKLRKLVGIQITDNIIVTVKVKDILKNTINNEIYSDQIKKTLKVPFGIESEIQTTGYTLYHESEEYVIADEKFNVLIYKK